MGWLLLALLAGLWTGLSLPLLWQRRAQQAQRQVGEQAEQTQEQLLHEWLYGAGAGE